MVGWISFVASYRTQFDRVIRLEPYNALRERLQKKSLDARRGGAPAGVLNDSRLLYNSIPRFWDGPADGEICDACDTRITKELLSD
jgi:hypothetical protein